MAAQILAMPTVKAPAQPVGHFVRIGETGHQQLYDLHVQGGFSPKRVVLDASRLRYQKQLIEALRESGTQIVLDTKAAELAAQAKFSGFASGAPWGESGNGEPLGPNHFAVNAASDVIGQIARFAVLHRVHAVHAVLAPGHFLTDGTGSEWFDVDRQACIALRHALDREGGSHIAVDYMLIAPHISLNDVHERGLLADGLKDLPFDNLWFRASGFGSDGGPAAVVRFIKATSALHNLGKPIVADYLGGLVGLATASFGGISGFAHGIGERERFDARQWHKTPPPRKEDGEGFGRARRVSISGFGRSVTITELETLARARGGRRLVQCGNRECCSHGLQDMISNPKRHEIFQRFTQVNSIEQTPDLSRERHFLNGEMTWADRLARQIKELKTDDEKLTKRMVEHSRRMEKLRAALEHCHETRGDDAPRALAIIERSGLSMRRGVDRA